MDKATDFKFGRYIRRVHPNKSPLTIVEKTERRHIQGLPKVYKYDYHLRNGQSYELQILRAHLRAQSEQKPIKISGKVAVGVIRDSRKFSGHPHIRRMRIARSSLR